MSPTRAAAVPRFVPGISQTARTVAESQCSFNASRMNASMGPLRKKVGRCPTSLVPIPHTVPTSPGNFDPGAGQPEPKPYPPTSPAQRPLPKNGWKTGDKLLCSESEFCSAEGGCGHPHSQALSGSLQFLDGLQEARQAARPCSPTRLSGAQLSSCRFFIISDFFALVGCS